MPGLRLAVSAGKPHENNTQPAPFFTPWRLGLLLVFAVSVAIYLPCMMGAATWDDDMLISGVGLGPNRLVTSFTRPFLGIYYRPLTSFSFAVESLYAKDTPFFFHQTSILLHAFTAVAASCLVLLVSKKRLAGVFAGLFFGLQPMQVGATAWIGGRTDVLSTFFLALFLLALVQFHLQAKPAWLNASVAAYLLAALAKEQAAFVLPAVPLSVFVFGTGRWKDVRKVCVPFAFAVIVYAALWLHGGPPLISARQGISETIVLALRTLSFYGLSIISPNRASLLTFTLERFTAAGWTVLGAVFSVGIVWFVWAMWRSHRPIAWLTICGLLVYLPVSNFPPVPTYVVGPYRIAEPGLIAACLFGIGFGYLAKPETSVVAGLLIVPLNAAAWTTWWGVHQWNSNENLFAQAVQFDPHFIIGVTKHAQIIDNVGRTDEAILLRGRTLRWIFGTDHWMEDLEAGRTGPHDPGVLERLRTNEGNPYLGELSWLMCNQASSLMKKHQEAKAINLDRLAIGIEPKDHRVLFAYAQMLLPHDRSEAIRYMERANMLAPKSPVYAMALAHERVHDGRYSEAIALLTPIIRIVGWNAGPWLDLADAKIGLSDAEGAASALAGAQSAMMRPQPIEVKSRRAKIDAIRHRSERSIPTL